MLGAVLSGGRGRRMGGGKDHKVLLGHALLEHMKPKLEGFCERVVAVGTELPDLYADEGPLGGLLTALELCRDYLLVVPVDTPLLRVATLAALVEARGETPVVAAHDRLEPLIGVYPVASGPRLRSLFLQGERAVHRALEGLGVRRLQFEPRQFLNVNTPQDLDRAEGLLREGWEPSSHVSP